MADITALIHRIESYIRQNGNQEITGLVMQQVLEDIAGELNGYIEDEAASRQNVDSTLQQGVNTERQARIDADTALGQRITDEIQQEAQTRQNTDNALTQLINGLKALVTLYLFVGTEDDAGEDKKIYLIPGRKYKFCFKNDVTYTTTSSNKKLLIRKVEGSTEINIISVAASEAIQSAYTFTAVANDYYYVRLRADFGQKTLLYIIDVTDIEAETAQRTSETSLLKNSIFSYHFIGSGSRDGEDKRLYLIAGRKYKIFVKNDVVSTEPSHAKKFIIRKVVGTTETTIYDVSYDDTISPVYSITAETNDYYFVRVRADEGQETFVYVIDVTDIEAETAQRTSETSLLKNLILTYRFDGSNGHSGTIKNLYLIAGRTYKVCFKNDVTYTKISSNKKLLIRKVVGSSYVNIVSVEPETALGTYVISAEANDYYYILLRADEGQETYVEVHDITDVHEERDRAITEEKKIKDSLVNIAIFDNVSDLYYKGLYGINTSGNTVDVNTGASANFHTWVIPVTEGNIFSITGQGGDTYGRYAFIKANGDVVEKTNDTAIVTNSCIITPTLAEYLVVNLRKTQQHELKVAINNLDDEVYNNDELSLINYGYPLLDEARSRMMEHNVAKCLINFAFITDTHIVGNQKYAGDEVYAKANCMLYRDFINEGIVDFAIHCGDVYTSYAAKRAEAFKCIDEFTRLVGNTKVPIMYAKGNHDCNPKSRIEADMENLDWEHNDYFIITSTYSYTQIQEEQWDGVTQLYTSEFDNNERITRYQWYLLTQNHLDVVHNADDYYGGYYYKDYSNIRVIVLNNYDTDVLEVYNMSETEKTWFTDVALNTDKYVLVICHCVLDSSIFNSIKSFIRNSGKIIALIHGHTHMDELEYKTVDNTTYCVIGVNRGFNLASNIAIDGNNAYCFSIFSIDIDSKKLYETRVGVGEDRVFDIP